MISPIILGVENIDIIFLKDFVAITKPLFTFGEILLSINKK